MSCHVQTEECEVALYQGKEVTVMKKKGKRLRCLVYLSTQAEERTVEEKEKKQLRYIREYAKAHNIEIVKIYRRGILGQYEVNRHFNALLAKLHDGEADGILLANMGTVSTDEIDAYCKVGKVHAAGGQIVTVDEGNLDLKIKTAG